MFWGEATGEAEREGQAPEGQTHGAHGSPAEGHLDPVLPRAPEQAGSREEQGL